MIKLINSIEEYEYALQFSSKINYIQFYSVDDKNKVIDGISAYFSKKKTNIKIVDEHNELLSRKITFIDYGSIKNKEIFDISNDVIVNNTLTELLELNDRSLYEIEKVNNILYDQYFESKVKKVISPLLFGIEKTNVTLTSYRTVELAKQIQFETTEDSTQISKMIKCNAQIQATLNQNNDVVLYLENTDVTKTFSNWLEALCSLENIKVLVCNQTLNTTINCEATSSYTLIRNGRYNIINCRENEFDKYCYSLYILSNQMLSQYQNAEIISLIDEFKELNSSIYLRKETLVSEYLALK